MGHVVSKFEPPAWVLFAAGLFAGIYVTKWFFDNAVMTTTTTEPKKEMESMFPPPRGAVARPPTATASRKTPTPECADLVTYGFIISHLSLERRVKLKTQLRADEKILPPASRIPQGTRIVRLLAEQIVEEQRNFAGLQDTMEERVCSESPVFCRTMVSLTCYSRLGSRWLWG